METNSIWSHAVPFDSVVTAAMAREVRNLALCSYVKKVYQPRELEIYIHFRYEVLLISAHPETFRLHFVSETPPNPHSPPRFCRTLRKYLVGARLESVEHQIPDRTVHLQFSGEQGSVTLTAELMGRHSNIILIDSSGRILDCIKHVTSKVSRARELLPGLQYVPPPKPPRPGPFEVTDEQMEKLISSAVPLPDAIAACFWGISPFTAREIVARAEAPTPTGYCDSLIILFEKLRDGDIEPAVILDDAGRPCDCWAFMPKHIGAGRAVPERIMSDALERAYTQIQQTAEVEGLRRQVISKANDALQRIRRRIDAAEQVLSQSERADEYRIAGELLTANLSAIHRGATSVELVNYYDPDLKPITIALDPELSPAENAARYFEKHRKARGAEARAREQLAEAQQDERTVRSILDRAGADSAEALRGLLVELDRFLPRQVPTPKPLVRQRRGEPSPKIRRIQTPEGWEILVGETKEANDYLTTKIAAPDDLWFHVRAAASAHVVIRTAKRPEAVPHSVILRAARIAAANSEAKHSSVVPVDYTLKRYVTKPRGSPPGAVLYRNEKTLHVEPER